MKASVSLAGQKIGGLIVIERYTDLSAYIADGTRLDARLSKELLYSLFVPERQNPLHDDAQRSCAVGFLQQAFFSDVCRP